MNQLLCCVIGAVSGLLTAAILEDIPLKTRMLVQVLNLLLGVLIRYILFYPDTSVRLVPLY